MNSLFVSTSFAGSLGLLFPTEATLDQDLGPRTATVVASSIQHPHSVLQLLRLQFAVPAQRQKGLERKRVLKHPRTCLSLLLQVVS